MPQKGRHQGTGKGVSDNYLPSFQSEGHHHAIAKEIRKEKLEVLKGFPPSYTLHFHSI